MIVMVWIINDIHIEFNDIHWEGCLHITRRVCVCVRTCARVCVCVCVGVYCPYQNSDIVQGDKVNVGEPHPCEI